MKIYTPIETEETCFEPLEMKTEGARSFESFYNARRHLANRIVSRAQSDRLFARALLSDENHGDELREFLSKETGRNDIEAYFHRHDDGKEFPGDVKKALRRFVMDVASGENAYHVYAFRMDELSIRFDIVESEIGKEGESK